MAVLDGDFLVFSLPLISMAIGLLPFLFHRPASRILAVGFLAYFLAILVKTMIQAPTIHSVLDTPTYIQGLYFGLQTVILEGGFALIFSRLFKLTDGIGYGLSLAFMENFLFEGFLVVLSYLLILILHAFSYRIPPQAVGPIDNAYKMVYGIPLNQLVDLYIPLKLIDRGISLMVHLIFGWASVLYFLRGDKRYLLFLGVGFVDFFTAYYRVLLAEGAMSSLFGLQSLILLSVVFLTYTLYLLEKRIG